MWSRLGIRQKLFALFTIIAFVPLVVVNVIWLRSSQTQLKQAATNRQSTLLSISAQRVNESLDAKINSVITHSQDSSVIKLNIDQAKLNLMQFANQDSDIQRIALIDSSGNEQVVINNHEFSKTLNNVKTSDAFKVVTQLSNSASVSDVAYSNGQPKVIISVPLFNDNQLGTQNLTNSQALVRRYGADIKGALVVDVSLSNLWKSLLSAKLGNDGYVYLVNGKGNLIAYQDQKFINSHPNLLGTAEVNNAVKVLGSSDLEAVAANYKPSPTVTTSETGVKVLSSNYPISRAKWAVIGEESISSVYSASHRATAIAIIITLIGGPISIGLVLLATRNIITPIRQLTNGAVRMSGGDFGHHLLIRGRDELAVLAQTFNKMGDDLQSLLGRYSVQNINLIAERTKLQAVLDTITDGVVVLDGNFNIMLVNKTVASLTLQADPSSIYGQPWLEVFNMSYEGQTFHNQLLNGELLYFHDITLQLGDQQKYIDATAIHVLDDPNGIAYILTIHDITQRRELENMRLDFVSMAAHELRTPLTAISGYLDLISRYHEDPKKNLEYVEHASASAAMLGNLINNLLSLSRIERHSLKLNINELNWSEVVPNEVKNQSFAAETKHIEINCQLPEKPVYVTGDEAALREVVGNLISNAIHYTEDGGKITVSVKVLESGVTTTVADTGIGMPENVLSKLFTKYYRAEGGLTSNSQGTGIGLYISKTIVEAHGGSIGVSSTYGKGSSFYFDLPPLDPKH